MRGGFGTRAHYLPHIREEHLKGGQEQQGNAEPPGVAVWRTRRSSVRLSGRRGVVVIGGHDQQHDSAAAWPRKLAASIQSTKCRLLHRKTLVAEPATRVTFSTRMRLIACSAVGGGASVRRASPLSPSGLARVRWSSAGQCRRFRRSSRNSRRSSTAAGRPC